MANQFQFQILSQFNVAISERHITLPTSDQERAFSNLQEEPNSRNMDNATSSADAETEAQQDIELMDFETMDDEPMKVDSVENEAMDE